MVKPILQTQALLLKYLVRLEHGVELAFFITDLQMLLQGSFELLLGTAGNDVAFQTGEPTCVITCTGHYLGINLA